jgi:hypothetical protein
VKVYLPTEQVMDLANRLAARAREEKDRDLGDAASFLGYLAGERDMSLMQVRATRVESFMEGLDHGYYEARRAHGIVEDAPSRIPRIHGRAIDYLEERIAVLGDSDDPQKESLTLAYQNAIKALEIERP